MNRREASALAQGGSVVATLPRDWCAQNSIRAGDRLVVEYDSNLVTIRPLRKTGGRT